MRRTSAAAWFAAALACPLACGGGTAHEGGRGSGAAGMGAVAGAGAAGMGATTGSGGAGGSDATAPAAGAGGTDASAPGDACVPERYQLTGVPDAGAELGCVYAWPDALVGEAVGWCTRINVLLTSSAGSTHLPYAGSEVLCGSAEGWYLVEQSLHFCPASCDAHRGSTVEVDHACAIPPC